VEKSQLNIDVADGGQSINQQGRETELQ